MAKLSKGLVKYSLEDFTQEQAKAQGKVFYQAWVDHNKIKLQKQFDKRQKEKGQ